ncbi:MAG: AtpZ/AtpI family protein [Halanaerobiales bacterium]
MSTDEDLTGADQKEKKQRKFNNAGNSLDNEPNHDNEKGRDNERSKDNVIGQDNVHDQEQEESVSNEEHSESQEKFLAKIEKDVVKKIKARKKGNEILFGIGVFGIVGWSIAIPTVICIALGVYLDGKLQSDFSWTLTLLFAGVIIGCINAWYWVKQKSEED